MHCHILPGRSGYPGDRAAAPLLVKLCRRHAGFDRSRTVPEVAMALEALAAIGAADSAPLILQLVEQDALGPASTAAFTSSGRSEGEAAAGPGSAPCSGRAANLRRRRSR